jgi:hypothetical protein
VGLDSGGRAGAVGGEDASAPLKRIPFSPHINLGSAAVNSKNNADFSAN